MTNIKYKILSSLFNLLTLKIRKGVHKMKNIFQILLIVGFIFSSYIHNSYADNAKNTKKFDKSLSSAIESFWFPDHEYCEGRENSLLCRHKQSKANMLKIKDRITYQVNTYYCINDSKISDDEIIETSIMINWYQYRYKGKKPNRTLVCEVLVDGLPVSFAHHQSTFCENNTTTKDDSIKEVLELHKSLGYVCQESTEFTIKDTIIFLNSYLDDSN